MAENFFAQFDEEPPKKQNFFAQFDEEQSSPPGPEESEGVLKEFGEGVISGLTKIPQGILELGATGIDLVAGTDTAGEVTDTFEYIRGGVDPVGFVGKGAEAITQFGIPGAVAVKGLNAVQKGRKVKAAAAGVDIPDPSKVKQLAMEALAAGAADYTVATNDTESFLEGFYDGASGPESERGMSNRGQALENLKDRFFLGVEGAVAVPLAAGAIKYGKKALDSNAAKTAGQIAGATPGVQGGRRLIQQGAKSFLKGTSRVGDAIDNLDATVMSGKGTNKQELLSRLLGSLRYRGRLPFKVGLARNLNKQGMKVNMTKAEKHASLLEKDIEQVVLEMGQGSTPVGRETTERGIRKYLEAEADQLDEIYDLIPDGISRSNLDDMRKHILDFSEEAVTNSAFLKGDPIGVNGKNLQTLISESIAGKKGYLRREYEIHTTKGYVPTVEARALAKGFFQTGGKESNAAASKGLAEKELTLAFNRDVGLDDINFKDPALLQKMGAAVVKDADGNDVIKISGKVNDEAAENATAAFLNRHSDSGARNIQAGRVGADRLNTDMFLERKNISPELRDLMGEMKAPSQAYVQTISDLANFKASDNFFEEVAELAAADKGIGKWFKDGNNYTEAQKAELRKKGYVELGAKKEGQSFRPGEISDDILRSDSSKAGDITLDELDQSGWGSLKGYMVPRQIYDDLTVHKFGNATTLSNLGTQILNTVMKAKGISQYSKTVLSPITQLRNLTSASMFATMQGNIGRGANLKESFDVVFNNMRNLGDEAMLKELAEMQNRGIIGTSAQLREIQELLAGFETGTRKSLSPTGKFQKGLNKKLGVGKYKASLKDFQKAADKLYQGSDDGWKIYNYKFEGNKLRNALKGLSLEDQYRHLEGKPMPPGTTVGQIDELVKDRAGQIVRDTVPNYDIAPELIRGFRKLPIGNFVTFPYEIYRTGFNTIDQAMKELASDIPGVQNIGLRRMTGAITTTTLAPMAAVQAGMLATGIGKDQIDAYKRSFGSPWEKYATLVPIGLDKKGNPQFINFSTFNPYNDIKKIADSAMGSFAESKRTGRGSSEALAEAMFTSAFESMKPFMEKSMAVKAFLEGNPLGKGITDTGASIFSQADSYGTRLKKGTLHMANAAIPNVLPFETRGGFVRPRKIVRALVGSEDGFIDSMDKYGTEYGLDRTTALGMAGFRPITFDPEKSVRYRGYDLKKKQSLAKQKFTSLADDQNINSNQLLQGYIDANVALRKADEEFYQMFEDGAALGLSRSKIKKILKDNNISGVDRISRGKADPYKVSSQVKRKMRRFGIYDQFPRDEINNVYRQLRKETLTTDPDFNPAGVPEEIYVPREEPVSNAPNFFSQFDNVSAPAAPSGNFFSQFDTAPVAPPVNRTNVSSTLLGDPKNADIINRRP